MQNGTTTYPIQELSRRLQLPTSSLKRTIERMNLTTEPNDQLSPAATKTLILQYTKKAGKRSDQTIHAARQMANELGLSIEQPSQVAKIATKTVTAVERKATATLKSKSTKKKARIWSFNIEKFLKGTNFLMLVLLCAIAWQVHHTATVVDRMDDVQNTLSNVAFAIAIQFTALLMTIHNGGVNYLRTFAVIEFAINMAYYRPWHGDGSPIDFWCISVLISGTIAYTIFCYSKLLTIK